MVEFVENDLSGFGLFLHRALADRVEVINLPDLETTRLRG